MATITALIEVWVFAKIWMMLIASQYGSGPNQASWYGIATLVSIAIAVQLFSVQKAKTTNDDDDDGIGVVLTLVKRYMIIWLYLILSVLIACVVGNVTGWAS